MHILHFLWQVDLIIFFYMTAIYAFAVFHVAIINGWRKYPVRRLLEERMTANQAEDSGGQHSPTIPVQSIYSLLARSSRSCWLLNWNWDASVMPWLDRFSDTWLMSKRMLLKTTRGWRAWSLLWTMTSESEEHYRLLRHRVLPIWGQGLSDYSLTTGNWPA